MNLTHNIISSIEKLTVRISFEKDGKTPFGTGIVVNVSDSKYGYIFTARHVICKADKCSLNCSDKCENLVNDLTIQYLPDNEEKMYPFTICDKILFENEDFAILIFEKTPKFPSFSKLNILTSRNISFSKVFLIAGYTSELKSTNSIHHYFLENPAPVHGFEDTKIKFDISKTKNDFCRDIKGISGSGICSFYKNEVFLIGIDTTTQTDTGISGIRIPPDLNLKIPDKYPKIELCNSHEKRNLKKQTIVIQQLNRISKKNIYNEANTLIKIVEKEQKNIILLGESGVGKSYELKQLENYINEKNSNVKAFLYQLIDYTGQKTVDELLKDKYSDWNVSKFEYVIILDGFDNALNQTENIIKNINSIRQNFVNVHFIISSREIINLEQISKNLKDFEFYYLNPLSDNDIKQYLKSIGKKGEKLFNKANTFGFKELLQNPFYLQFLAKEDNIENYPSKTSVLKAIIQERFEHDKKNNVVGENISENEELIKKTLAKIAFEMKKKQCNTISKDELAGLLLIDEINCINGTIWNEDRFENALFQDYFAALQLKELSLEEIKKLVYIPKLNELKSFWRDVLILTIDLLSEDKSKYSEFVKWLCEVDKKLFLHIDKNGLDKDLLSNVFNYLFEYQIKTSFFELGWGFYENMRQLALIAEKQDWLFKIIEDNGDEKKVENAILNFPRKILYKQKLKDKFLEYLENEKKWLLYFTVDRLLDYNWIDESKSIEFCQKIIDKKSLQKNTSTIAKIIEAKNLTDKYIDLLLAFYKSTPKNEIPDLTVIHAIKKLKTKSSIQKLIDLIIQDSSNRSILRELFGFSNDFDVLVQLIIDCYDTDTIFFESVVKLYIELATKLNGHSAAIELSRFFIETKTIREFYEFIKNNVSDNYKKFECLAQIENIELIDFCVNDLKEQQGFIYYFKNNMGQNYFHDYFVSQINLKCNNFFNEQEKQEIVLKNYVNLQIEITLNKVKFIEELKNILRNIKFDIIRYRDLPIYEQDYLVKYQHLTNIVFEVIQSYVLKDATNYEYSKDELVENIEKMDIEAYCHEYLVIGLTRHDAFKSQLQNYKKQLQDWCIDKSHLLKTKSGHFYSYIIRNYAEVADLELSSEIWLDLIAFDLRTFELQDFYKYVILKTSKEEFKERLYENLDFAMSGKISLREAVYFNYFKFCAENKYKEPINLIKDCVIKLKFNTTYVNSEGIETIDKLMPENNALLEEIHKETKIDELKKLVIELLVKRRNSEYCKKLLNDEFSNYTSENIGNSKALFYLIQLKDISAMDFLINYIKERQNYPPESHYNLKLNLWEIDQIDKLIELWTECKKYEITNSNIINYSYLVSNIVGNQISKLAWLGKENKDRVINKLVEIENIEIISQDVKRIKEDIIRQFYNRSPKNFLDDINIDDIKIQYPDTIF